MQEHVKTASFPFHPSIGDWLAAGGDLTVNGQSFTANTTRGDPKSGDESAVFEAFFNLGEGAWVKGTVTYYPNDPIADCWFMLGYGHEGWSAPHVKRQDVFVVDAKSTVSIVQLDKLKYGEVLNTQTTLPRHFTYDFDKGVISKTKRTSSGDRDIHNLGEGIDTGEEKPGPNYEPDPILDDDDLDQPPPELYP